MFPKPVVARLGHLQKTGNPVIGAKTGLVAISGIILRLGKEAMGGGGCNVSYQQVKLSYNLLTTDPDGVEASAERAELAQGHGH